eukprot:TRINITY_DN3540_c0_g1_i1.p1 TRINITY_DN3540_c0_g1~~TRINITY_DN3540_c0_g1_i1.p1  ORF type:complete len:403 (-),score=62.06 TRINITY_DN3540_c0_g1_i1:8-1216(-)
MTLEAISEALVEILIAQGSGDKAKRDNAFEDQGTKAASLLNTVVPLQSNLARIMKGFTARVRETELFGDDLLPVQSDALEFLKTIVRGSSVDNKWLELIAAAKARLVPGDEKQAGGRADRENDEEKKPRMNIKISPPKFKKGSSFSEHLTTFLMWTQLAKIPQSDWELYFFDGIMEAQEVVNLISVLNPEGKMILKDLWKSLLISMDKLTLEGVERAHLAVVQKPKESVDNFAARFMAHSILYATFKGDKMNEKDVTRELLIRLKNFEAVALLVRDKEDRVAILETARTLEAGDGLKSIQTVANVELNEVETKENDVGAQAEVQAFVGPQPRPTSSSNRRFGPRVARGFRQAQKQRKQQFQGSCMLCTKFGHRVADCPSMSKARAQLNAVDASVSNKEVTDQ